MGFTREVTVAVWAGNFDGTPMTGSTGVTGAGPLFHEAMLAAMRGRTPAALLDHAGLSSVEVCALSGGRAAESCPHRRREWFLPGHEPKTECDLHEVVRIDPITGLRAGPGCAEHVERVFERYPHEYEGFARQSARPVAPLEFSTRCPGTLQNSKSGVPSILFPTAEATFLIDPGLRSEQEILLQADSSSARVTFYIDERPIATLAAPFRAPWRLEPGTHRVRVATSDGQVSEPLNFSVR